MAKSRNLRHRMVVQRRNSSLDDFSASDDEWEDAFPIWADLDPLRGESLVTAQKVVENVTHQIMTRWNPAIDESKRLVYQGRIFNVRSAVNIGERNRWLEILAVEQKKDVAVG